MILVTGATGHIGKQVSELLAAQRLPLRVLVREGDAPPAVAAEVAMGEYGDMASMRAAFRGVDTAFLVSASAPPGERAKLHAQAFQAASQASVKHLVYLSLQGAGAHSMYPYSRDHFESESALAGCGVAHTIIRNGKYTEQLLEPELAGGDGVLRGPITESRVAWISRSDSAKVIAALLPAPPGGVVTPTGPEALTLEETAKRLTQALGRTIRCQNESALVLRTRILAQGAPPWRADLWVGAYEAMALGEYAEVSDVSKWIGQAETLEATVASGALDGLRTP